MFENAIVRRPGRSITKGITTADMGKPDYQLALKQHDSYIEALQHCGVKVIVLPEEEKYPDSVFIEDTAVLADKCAVITLPGAESRQGEELSIRKALKPFFEQIENIDTPGSLEGGDVMRVGNHFYVGLSERTNEEGFRQFAAFFGSFGYSASAITMNEFLHLKTGLSYLENNNLLIAGEFVREKEFEKFNRIEIDESEAYAANCIWVNGTVLVPAGFPKTQGKIEKAGYPVIEVDVSEFRKLDGGLSCLSLRF